MHFTRELAGQSQGKYQETVSNMKMQMAGSLQAFQIDVSGDLTTVEKRTILTEGK